MRDFAPQIPLVPSPWNLNGSAYILLYRFSRQFVEANAFLPPDLRRRFSGGIGAVMLVDYATSGVGPYRELLFVPGLVRMGRKRRYTVSKIYVSTMESVVNGQHNWGLPKELADFEHTSDDQDDQVEHIRVSTAGATFFDLRVRRGRLSFPVGTWLYRPAIAQPWDNALLVTRPKAQGRVRLADIESLTVNERYFPDVSAARPLGVVRVDSFEMTFPKPHRLPLTTG